jgi:hypothetical protein
LDIFSLQCGSFLPGVFAFQKEYDSFYDGRRVH